MTDNRRLKHKIRARMASTGENYTAARRSVLESREERAGSAAEAPKAASGTGCPACGSDDYITEPGADGQPDYQGGLKTCDECGEAWV